MPPNEYATTLVVLDLIGIFVFAVTGALVAVRKNLDLFAALVLGGVTGLGGGFVRDVLIGATPPAALDDWRYLMVPVAAGLVMGIGLGTDQFFPVTDDFTLGGIAAGTIIIVAGYHLARAIAPPEPDGTMLSVGTEGVHHDGPQAHPDPEGRHRG